MNIKDIVHTAQNELSKLDNKPLSLKGMSSAKVRHMLNKAVSYPNTKYLEIGVWHGSTLYSALYKNNPTYVAAIDNFSEFNGQEEIFLDTMRDIGVKYNYFNSECFTFDKSLFRDKFNVYFYDGGHSKEDQEKALTYFCDAMEDRFLYICDDYNWPQVQEGTKIGIEKANLKIIEEQTLLSDYNGDKGGFWNGIYIAILEKQK